jgi:hypothetical protein
MSHEDEILFQQHQYDDRERSHTPPFIYSQYPPPDEMTVAPYSSAQPYHAMTTAEPYPSYMTPTVPCTLPPMTHFSDAIKRDPYPSEDPMSPYVNYYVPVDVNVPGPYDHHSNPHVSHVRNQSHHHHRS